MSQAPSPADESGEPGVPREITEFLVEISLGVHRYAMYPPGHSSLEPVGRALSERLTGLLRRRGQLSIGVARDQLMVDGDATPSKHPVLADMARRLHGHQLGALTLQKGVTPREIQRLLETLAADVERGADPVGLLRKEERPRWDHIELVPLGYDRLRLYQGDDGDQLPDRATELWLGLARTALETDVDAEEAPGAGELARTIRTRKEDAPFQKALAGHLLQLTEELQEGGGSEEGVIRQQLSGLIEELDEETLNGLLEVGSDSEQRRKFVLDANESLAVDSVLKVLQASASASGQNISTLLMRLLKKLARNAQTGPAELRARADEQLRENVEQLVEDWNLADPNPTGYSRVLDAMAEAAPAFRQESEEDVTGAVRIVQMGIEVNALGTTVERAVYDLVEGGEVDVLLDMLEDVEGDNVVAVRALELLTTRSRFRTILDEDQLDESTLARLVERMGADAVEPLLDALVESESRTTRRLVFDQLAAMGDGIGDALMGRLDDERWFVVRNLLALLQRLRRRPRDFDPFVFLQHAEPRVRREAFQLAVAEPRLRIRALQVALGDADERMVRMALLAVRRSIPEPVVPTLVKRVIYADRSVELRVLAVRTLVHASSPLARDTLLGLCDGGRTLFGRQKKLPSGSPLVVGALWALAHRWSEDPDARVVLEAARGSGDAAMQLAADGRNVA